VRPTQKGIDKMIEMLYQAKVGDGFKQVGMKRANSFFSTPQDAVSEAFALKEKMDSKYKNEIQWDFDSTIKGTTERFRILRGYLGGDRETHSFYLEISSMEPLENAQVVSPKKAKNITSEEKKVAKKVKKYLAK
jgi:hypothetical protein